MKWELHNGIYIPVDDLPPKVLIFIDESYLDNNSGKLQSALAVSSHSYNRTLPDLHRSELRKLGAQAKEFHGSNLSAGNKDIYLNFLRGFIDHSSALADISEVRSIISLDAADPYRTGNFDWAANQITGAFSKLGVAVDTNLAEEFARQVIWLSNHLHYVIPKPYKNDVVVIFDNTHRFAQLSRQFQAMQVNNLPGIVLREAWTKLTPQKLDRYIRWIAVV
jgi:hypothetical protein